MYANRVFNNINLFASADSFPLPSLSTWNGVNNTIVINYNDPSFSRESIFYIKIVPNFALYDLLSNRQFIYNLITFSQSDKLLKEVYVN